MSEADGGLLNRNGIEFSELKKERHYSAYLIQNFS